MAHLTSSLLHRTAYNHVQFWLAVPCGKVKSGLRKKTAGFFDLYALTITRRNPWGFEPYTLGTMSETCKVTSFWGLSIGTR
jgi:hypothetical protein